jgi:hypothetical protein
MGVDIHVLNFLLDTWRSGIAFGETLQVGRQGFHVGKHERPLLESLLQHYGLGNWAEEIAGQSYTERLFSLLGARSVKAIDFSRYEGAQIIHDLNNPIPDSLAGSCDTVFDGGSLEHIFNVPVGLANLINLVRVGGTVLTINGANNFLGHGFYQFSPELIYRTFSAENGFEARAFLAPAAGRPGLEPATDPAVAGRRLEFSRTEHPTYLMVVARKLRRVELFKQWPQQSDYVGAWTKPTAP